MAALAFVRTVILVHRQSAAGHHPSTIERVVLFAGSTAIVILTGLAAAIAFYATCWGGFAVGEAFAFRFPSQYRWLLGTGINLVAGVIGGFTVGIPLGIFVGLYLGGRVLIWQSSGRGDAKLSWRNRLILAALCVLATVASNTLLLFRFFAAGIWPVKAIGNAIIIGALAGLAGFVVVEAIAAALTARSRRIRVVAVVVTAIIAVAIFVRWMLWGWF